MDHHRDPEKTHYAEEVETAAVLDEKADAAAYKAGAIEAENVEHNMTVIQAVKAYPMASFWAFVVSCTIVSCSHIIIAELPISRSSKPPTVALSMERLLWETLEAS